MSVELQSFKSISEVATKFGRGAVLTNSETQGVMTMRRLGNLIAQGFGQGRNDGYVPWIRVTRRYYSPRSNIARHYVTTQQRGLHLLSRLEQQAARFAAWLGAVEIREQYAMFPWSHPSPLAGLDQSRDAQLEPAPAYLEIAKQLKLRHGHYVGSTGVPFVATCDLVLRLGTPPTDRVVFWNVKPQEKLQTARTSSTWRRIRLEQEYARQVEAHHFIFHEESVPEMLLANIDFLAPTRAEWNSPERIRERAQFAEAFASTRRSLTLIERINEAAHLTTLAEERGFETYRTCAWAGQLDIDLTRHLAKSRPVRQSNPEFLSNLRRSALGEVQ